MNAAIRPVQRHPDAKLLRIDGDGEIRHGSRFDLLDFLRPGDLVVANDAATLPASLPGIHGPTGLPLEVRLAGRQSLEMTDICDFRAIVFGAGNHLMRTEDRPLPPRLKQGDMLILGPLRARVRQVLSHPRLIRMEFLGEPEEI